MRVRALAFRILKQLRHDRRTLALVFVAPIFVLSMLYLILDASTTTITVGVVNAPQKYIDRLDENNVNVIRCTQSEGLTLMQDGEIIATINIESGKSYINIDGSNSTKANTALTILENAKNQSMGVRSDLKSDIRYVYGMSDLSMFDNFGAVLIGFLVFFFVFLISGISFLQERKSGTLEKVLSTPIKRWELVAGYVLGFGILTFFQSLFVTLFVVYVLDIMMVGSMWLVLLITALTAMSSLTLGMLLSTLAASEFQMMQFIPIVVIPQVFFCGLFDLSPGWAMVGRFMPLYYVADGLKKIMIRGDGFFAIAGDVCILLVFSAIFMVANIRILKRYRRI